MVAALFAGYMSSAQKEVTVMSVPADAEIFEIASNGFALKKGVGSVILKLEKEKPVTIEVRKPGFVAEKKTFLRVELLNIEKQI